ncbi:sugar phosphate isomerase/epimerase [Luteolibacter pohnpeiensis]|uniref:Sugar phosphate isomerase/epimerase n=1 Tax=Luteolibacter pohnpeiensis TaxID=454153 RepID=A0A934SDG1_9BACT|nr:sugar phosphate isomerase/epimerase [Luteolibacter pohnpeiensis]MBK1883854.1 sugar phosphate isomerase/epimerase [Luteolibacter pohnpeiensis]
MMNRRKFIQSTVATSLVLGLTSRALANLGPAESYIKNIGLQAYTLRDLLVSDPEGTLKAVADAGYKQVELYNFPNCDPLIKGAKDAGLKISSSHFDAGSILDPQDKSYAAFMKILEKAKANGMEHLVVPYLPDTFRKTADDWKKTAENLNVAAAKSKEAGIQLAYHNHNFEFHPMEDGTTGYDIFMKEFSPDMQFEIDLFWVKVAGLEPAELIKKLKGRVSQLHIKDLKKGIQTPNFGGIPGDAFQEVGNGVLDWKPIFEAAKASGVKNCHVEQDQSPDPLGSIKTSIAFLQKL